MQYDPTEARLRHTWSSSATLHGVLVVDGTMVDSPQLEQIDGKRLKEERYSRLRIDWSAVGIADLKMGGFIETCDLIEYWFASIDR